MAERKVVLVAGERQVREQPLHSVALSAGLDRVADHHASLVQASDLDRVGGVDKRLRSRRRRRRRNHPERRQHHQPTDLAAVLLLASRPR